MPIPVTTTRRSAMEREVEEVNVRAWETVVIVNDDETKEQVF